MDVCTCFQKETFSYILWSYEMISTILSNVHKKFKKL